MNSHAYCPQYYAVVKGYHNFTTEWGGKSDAPCSLACNEGSDKASCAVGWVLSETHAASEIMKCKNYTSYQSVELSRGKIDWIIVQLSIFPIMVQLWGGPD